MEVLFHTTCILNGHVSKICQVINHNLYSVGKIHKYLDTPTAEKMISCSITSPLDYCKPPLRCKWLFNILFTALSVQCPSGCCPCASFSTTFHVLKDPHWLPVEQRIEYIKLFVTKPLHTSPRCCLYIHQTGDCDQRSETNNLLTFPWFRLEGFGRRCFAYAAPSFWNPLHTLVKCAYAIDAFKSSDCFNFSFGSIPWSFWISNVHIWHRYCYEILINSVLINCGQNKYISVSLYITGILSLQIWAPHPPIRYSDFSLKIGYIRKWSKFHDGMNIYRNFSGCLRLYMLTNEMAKRNKYAT